MANKILIRRSSTQGATPTTGQLDLAELAINTYDGRLFAKKDAGSATVVDLTKNDPIRILGDATSTFTDSNIAGDYTSNVTMTLKTVNSNSGTFGGKTGQTLTVPIVTVNSKGLVTSVTTTTFGVGVTGDFGSMAAQNANAVEITGGSIDGTPIGFTNAAAGKFTDVTASGDVLIQGSLTVNGTVTTVNSSTVSIKDKNIELANNATTAAQADGAGITVTGPATPATITYAEADNSWNFNKSVNVSGDLDVTGAVTASSFAGDMYPTGGSSSSGGIMFPSNPGGGTGDNATIRYYAYSGEKSVLELKVTNDTSASPGNAGPDIIKLNASGGTEVTNKLTAGSIESTGALTADSADITNNVSAGSVSTTDLTATGTVSLGTVSAVSINATAIGNVTASTGAFTTLTGTSGTIGALSFAATSTGNVTVNTDKIVLRSSNGDIITQGNLYVTNGAITVKDLVITGTTSLAGISSSAVAATQLVYGGSDGAFKGESDLTYNETTNTLSAGSLTLSAALSVTGTSTFTAAASFNSTATFTSGVYTTGALKLAGDGSIAGALQVQGAIYKGGNEVLSNADTIDGGTF